jgi:hypothetical protein
MTDTCQHCKAVIHLIPTGKHFKWVTNPGKPETWTCPADPEKPVLSHSPEATK